MSHESRIENTRTIEQEKWLRACDSDVSLDVLVTVGSHHGRVMGIQDNRLKIQIPHDDMRSSLDNDTCRFIANELNIERVRVQVLAGQNSSKKTIHIQGISMQKVWLRLAPHQDKIF